MTGVVKVTNNAFGTLASSISSSATTIALDSGQGARFPTLSSPDYFYGTLIDTSNNLEIVKVTARSTDSLTVTRAQDNTSARAFSTGDRFELRPTAKLFEDIQTNARDLNGQELILDADGDTSITADTDDQIDIKIAGSDSIRIKANEIENVSGDLTIDVAGNISLDADDGGHVRFKDGGAEYLSIYEDANNNPIIQASIADTNILFKGTDTGAGVITALDLDIANSGFATFNASAFFNENSNDTDFRIKSVNNANMFYVDASTDKIGIGTDTPAQVLDIQSSSTLSTRILATGNNTRAQLLAQAHTSGGADVNMVLGSFGDSTRGEISMNTNHPLRFYTNNDPTKGVELETDGDLNIKDGNLIIETLGHGINFAGPTAQAGSISQILDAYEEGTFSASMVPSNSGTITLNNGVFKLAYTKIGRKVHIQGLLETTSKSSPVGTLRITNLPFTSVDDIQYAGRAGGGLRATNVEGTGFGNGDIYSCYVLEGGNILYADIDASTVHPSNYSQFYISISYNAT